MAMTNNINWTMMPFSFPPHDMAFYPYSDAYEPSYPFPFFLQPLHLEDYLGVGDHPSAPHSPVHHPELLASATPEDAASAVAGDVGAALHSPEEAGSEFGLSVFQPPLPEEEVKSEFSLSLFQPPPTPPATAAVARTTVQKTTTSVYRGVSRHRWTGRYEAHLWDNSFFKEGQKRKGRQVYLGGYDDEEKAARAYDLAALKYWGLSATTNHPISNYSQEMEDMKRVSKPEFIASIRRHHGQERWQARIGRVAGNKHVYLGTFTNEEEAAEAYDVASIKYRGVNAVTNFELSSYNLESIARTELPIGSSSKRRKRVLQASSSSQITVASSQNHDIVPTSLYNLQQLYPAADTTGTQPFTGLSESDADLSCRRLHWLTSDDQNDDQDDRKHPAAVSDSLLTNKPSQ